MDARPDRQTAVLRCGRRCVHYPAYGSFLSTRPKTTASPREHPAKLGTPQRPTGRAQRHDPHAPRASCNHDRGHSRRRRDNIEPLSAYQRFALTNGYGESQPKSTRTTLRAFPAGGRRLQTGSRKCALADGCGGRKRRCGAPGSCTGRDVKTRPIDPASPRDPARPSRYRMSSLPSRVLLLYVRVCLILVGESLSISGVRSIKGPSGGGLTDSPQNRVSLQI